MARYSTLQLITPPTFTNKLVLSSTGTFTVPEGITVIRASVMGAGGNAVCRTAGAGGGFAQKILTVRPGCSYCVVSASSAGAFSCFTGVCATGATTSSGSGTGGDINNSGASGGSGGGSADKTGCFYFGGGGGSGGGRSGPGLSPASAGSGGCFGVGGRGAVGTGGAVGGFTGCCCGAAVLAGNPATVDIGFESGGGGGGQGSYYADCGATQGGYGSGGGGCGCCNGNCRSSGSGGRGFVVVEF